MRVAAVFSQGVRAIDSRVTIRGMISARDLLLVEAAGVDQKR